MGWSVDDIDLDTLAFNISNRAASWKTPAKRGDNLVIPGRHGAKWLPNKPFEQGALTLSMWAVGANEDGSVPFVGNAARKVRENIDKLTAIFGQSSKLLDVVRVSSTAFGVENVVNDPSFETPAVVSPWTSYQNCIINPAMRATTASVDEVNNLMPNPQPVTFQTPSFVNTFENLILDSQNKKDRAQPKAMVAVNSWGGSSFEENVNPAAGEWLDAANTNGNVTGYSSFDYIANPNGGDWFLSIELTGNISANGLLGTRPSMPTRPSTRPYFSFRARRSAAMTVGTRTVQARVIVTDSSDATVTNGPWQSFTLPAYTGDENSWATFNYDSSSLTNTADGRNKVEFRTGEAWVTGDRFYMDMMTFTNAGETGMTGGYWDSTAGVGAGPYFDAGLGWVNIDYVTPANAPWTRSRWNAYKDTRWTVAPATGPTSAYYAFAYTPNDTDPTGTAVNFVAFGNTTGGTQDFYLDCGAAVAGETYSYNFNWRAATGTHEVRLQKKGTGDANYVDVGSAFTFGGGSGANVTGSQMIGTATNSYPPSTYTAVAGDLLRIRVNVPVRKDANPMLQLNSLNVTNLSGSQFNGDTVDTVNSLYAWSGTAFASKPVLQRRRMKRISGRHGWIELTDSNRVEAVCPGTGVTTNIVTDNFAIITGLRGIQANASVTGGFTAQGTANSAPAPSAVASVVFLDAGSAILSTVSGQAVALNTTQTTAAYQTVSVTATPSQVPSTATQVRLEISLVSPVAGQILNAKQFGIYTYGAPLTTIGLPTYFDGTTTGASWVGTANDSTSKITFSGTEPAHWVRENGINLGVWIPGGAQKTGKSPDSYLSFRHPMETTMAVQEYQFGIDSYAEVFDSAGARVDAPIDVYLEFRTGTTAVVGAPVYLGTLSGNNADASQPLQTTVIPTATFDHIAVVYRSRAIVSATAAAIFKAYLFPSSPASFSSPVPRIDANKVNNPYFTYGLDLWATTGSPVVTSGVCSMPNSSTITSSPKFVAPTHVKTVTTSYTSVGSPKTSAAFDVLNGDLIVIQAAAADSTHTLGTPTWTGTGTVAAQPGASINTATFNNVATWSIPVTATGTGRTVSVTNTNTTTAWGFSVSIWRNHNGIGAVAEVATTGPAAPSLGITTTAPASGLNVFVADITSANTGTPRTWRSINGAPIYETGFGDSTNSTYYSGVVSDAGSAGSKTVGLTVPSNAKFTIVAVEIKPPTPTAISGVPVQPPQRVGYVGTPMSVGTAKTSPTFDVENGDLIVITAVNESSTLTLPTPTWTGSGSVFIQEDLATGDARGRIWAIAATAAATLRTVSISGYGSSSSPWAMDVTVWRSAGGVGVQNQALGTSGAPGVTQTHAANSAAQIMIIDTLGSNSNAPTWLSVNGTAMTQARHSPPTTGVTASAYSAYSLDTGAAGSKILGMSAPSSGLTWGAVAIEILGSPQATFITRAKNGSGDGRLTPSIIWTKTDYSTVTTTLPAINSTSLNTPVGNSVAIPSGAAVASVKYASTVTSGSNPELSFSYFGLANSGFTHYSDVDPSPFYYGDATEGDFFGSPGWWSATADDSFSNFQPAVSPSWVNVTTPTGVSVHELPTPGIDYGVWNGKVGGILAASKGSTKVVRSLGVPTFGRKYLSGEISVGTKPFASAVVRVYQATSTTAAGTLLYVGATIPSASFATVSWSDLVVTESFVYVEVTYAESQNVSGYRVFMDNLMMTTTTTELAADYPGYFDGSIGGVWSGNANNSISIFTGGGRRAWCEVVEAIDMTSQAGGTRAEFNVDMVIPGAFWEDLTASSMTFNLPSLAAYEQTLHALASATAPIDDALITLTVTGVVTNLTLTDVASGAELTISGTLPSKVIIDNANFRVTNQSDVSIITSVTRKNSNQLLPLNPMSSTEAPKIKVNGSGAGSIVMEVVAKRRYLVA